MESLDASQVTELKNASVNDDMQVEYDDTGSPVYTDGTSTSPDYPENQGFAYNDLSCWDYWQDHYYPKVIERSYPVYVQERAQDKGKKAYEIVKELKDKRLVKIDKVEDFIDIMDVLIKTL